MTPSTPHSRTSRLRLAALAVTLLGMTLGVLPASVAAQGQTETLLLEDRASGATARVAILRPDGTAMLRADDLAVLGFRWTRVGLRWTAAWSEHEIEVEADRAAVRIDGDGVQLTTAPRLVRGDLYLPVQLLLDVVADRLPELVVSEEVPPRVILLPGGVWTEPAAPVDATGSAVPVDAPGAAAPVDAPEAAAPRAERVRPVVVIDPGHGGQDPGAIGPSGVREKDVALGVGRQLARILEETGEFEVHLTRDDDRLVPLWRRGANATEIKGERPGLFVSIHTNAVDNRRVRGFETYFLAEARTEDERRLAELENAAAQIGRAQGRDLSTDPELGFILNELRNFDHQHWSADLAAVMQEELEAVHPGPNRGVKQGPLAVITNSIMPSVLVELGFISNPEEERLIASEAFQSESAEALARAIRAFFEGYPPGASGGVTAPVLRRLVTCALVTASAGCVYYNALYNAELAFRRGEDARFRGAEDSARVAYRLAAEGAKRAWASEPDGEWAARALLLAAHSAVRVGEVAEARAHLAMLEAVPAERVPDGFEGRVEVIRGAIEVLELRAAAGLSRLERVRLDPLDDAWLAESWVWRGRALARLGRVDEAWAAFDFALGEAPDLTLALAAERAPIALEAGRPNETGAALERLLTSRTGAPWVDTVLAVARRAERSFGPGLAAELLEPVRRDEWPADPRDRVLLAQVGLLLSAGDTAAADETLAWLAEGATDGAVDARLVRARLHVSRARVFGDLVPIRRMLLPVADAEAARTLLLDISETELLAQWGTQGDVPAWFAAGEVARDELGAPGLAGALFLTAAEAGVDGPWVAKSLLAASTVLSERELRERLRRRALRQQLDPYVDRLAPGYLASDDFVRREAELAERVRELRVRAAAEALRLLAIQPGTSDR